jgi:hypothetical protein
MSVLSTKTKARVGVKAAKQGAKHPKLALLGARGAKPVVRGVVDMRTRHARHHAAVVLAAGQSIVQTALEAVQQAAQSAALTQVPRKRTAPRVAVGIVAGAAAMYFLDPASGDERRRKVLGLVTPNGGGDQPNEPEADNEAGGPAHPAPGHMPPEHQ